MTEIPTITTRRPTGKVPWPMLCIAGVEKAGKSYGAALLSASDLIDRTFYIEIGEGAADQYGDLPGVRYEIVEHDGSYDGIGRAIWAATMQPRENGKPHAIVIDSLTELWDLLADEQQLKANQRVAARAAERKQSAPTDDAQITMDLWNVAKKKWRKVIDMLRVYDGPTILLTRLEQVAVMRDGKPTTDREWKVRAEKNLVFECDGIVKMYAPQVAKLSGLRSTRLQVPPGSELPLPGFTIDGLLRKMGLDGTVTQGSRSYTAPRPQDAEELQDRPMLRHTVSSGDEWTAPPPEMVAESMAVTRERPPNPITSAQQKKMHALLSEKGYGDRATGLKFLSATVGRDITSSKMLTKADAAKVIEALEAFPPSEPLADRLAAWMREAQSPDELAEHSEWMWKAHEAGELTQAEVSKLQDISLKRESEITATGKAAA